VIGMSDLSDHQLFASRADQPYNQGSAGVSGSATSCLVISYDSFAFFKRPPSNTKENFMSAPSRRPEIRRRRTRAEKIAKLRKRLAAASVSADKDRLTAKLHRVELVSPGNPLIKSA